MRKSDSRCCLMAAGCCDESARSSRRPVSAESIRLGPPSDRTVTPYAGEPTDLSPYAKFAQPYDLNYVRSEYLCRGGTRHS